MDILVSLLKIAFDKLSPQIREAIVQAVKNLEKIASGSPNKWDDIAVKVLKLVLGIT